MIIANPLFMFILLFTLTNARKIIITSEYQTILAEKSSQNIWKNIDLLLKNAIELNKINSPVATICSAGFSQSYKIYVKELKLLGINYIKNTKTENNDIQIRDPRSIRPIGELWSFLSGNPSPSEFDNMQTNVEHIKNLVLDEVKESDSVEKIVKQDHVALSKIDAKIDLLLAEEKYDQNELNLTENALKIEIQASGLCSYGSSLENIINWEFMEIKNIIQDSKFNFANLNMFPPEKIYNILKTKKNGKFANYAKFRKSDLLELYRVNSASLAISGDGKIISAMAVPLLSEGQMHNTFDFSIPSYYNTRLDPLIKTAGKKIDLCICSNHSRKLTLFSSEDLDKCQHGFSKTTFICKQRNVHLFGNPDSCSKKILPKILVFQISEIKFLIESCGETQLVCDNILQKTYNITEASILTVPSNCFAKNLHFHISTDLTQKTNTNKINTNFELASTEGSKIKVEKIGSLEDHIKNNFTEINKKLEKIAEVVKINEKNKLDFENEHTNTIRDANIVKSDHAIHGATMGAAFGGSFFFIIMVTIIILGIYKYCDNVNCCKKKSNLKNSPVVLNINNVENADTATKVDTKDRNPPEVNHKNENNKKVENPVDDPDAIDTDDVWVEK